MTKNMIKSNSNISGNSGGSSNTTNTTDAVVDAQYCHTMTNPTTPFMLVVHRGEKLLDSLVTCAKTMQLHSASLSGLGALENVQLAYYDFAAKEYRYQRFQEIYELVALNGNITRLIAPAVQIATQDQYVVHAHVVLAGTAVDDHTTVSGHLSDATVAVTAEITVIPFNAPIMRRFNSDLGVNLIHPQVLRD